MKNICLLLLVFLPLRAALAQDSTTPRSVSITIVNPQGKAVSSNNIVVFRQGVPTSATAPKKGYLRIDGVAADTLNVMISSNMYQIPIGEMDSIVLVTDKGQLSELSYNKSKTHNTGYGNIRSDQSISPSTSVDMSQLDGYRDLADYMQGRVAGVQVARSGGEYKLIIRGGSSLILDNGALVIIDGVPMSFDSANSMVNIRDIKSVDVLKDGGLYGARGANGVVIITTK